MKYRESKKKKKEKNSFNLLKLYDLSCRSKISPKICTYFHTSSSLLTKRSTSCLFPGPVWLSIL